MKEYYTPKDEVLTYTIAGSSTLDIASDFSKVLSCAKFTGNYSADYYIMFVRISSGTSVSTYASSISYQGSTSSGGGIAGKFFTTNYSYAEEGEYDGLKFKKKADTEIFSVFATPTGVTEFTSFVLKNSSTSALTFTLCSMSHLLYDQKLKGQGIKLAGTNVGRVTGVDYNGLGGNFYAPESPITAESYATLISNASQVTDKAITISTESAKEISNANKYFTYKETIGAMNGSTGAWMETNNYTSWFVNCSDYVGNTIILTKVYDGTRDIFLTDKNSYSNGDTVNYSKLISASDAETKITITEEMAGKYIYVYIRANSTTIFSKIEMAYQGLITTANSKGFEVKTKKGTITWKVGGYWSSTTGGFMETNQYSYTDLISVNGGESLTIDYASTGAGAYIVTAFDSNKSILGQYSYGKNTDIATTTTYNIPSGDGVAYIALSSRNSSFGSGYKNPIADFTTYTLLPSLSFDGVHYIDSGIYADGDTDFEIDFNIATLSTYNHYFGGYNNSARSDLYMLGCDNAVFNFNFGNTYKIATSTATANYRYIVALNDLILSFNGAGQTISDKTFSGTYSIYIGAYNQSGKADTPTAFTLYSFTINGQLFIPSNNGTTDGLLNLSTLEFKPLTAV